MEKLFLGVLGVGDMICDYKTNVSKYRILRDHRTRVSTL